MLQPPGSLKRCDGLPADGTATCCLKAFKSSMVPATCWSRWCPSLAGSAIVCTPADMHFSHVPSISVVKSASSPDDSTTIYTSEHIPQHCAQQLSGGGTADLPESGPNCTPAKLQCSPVPSSSMDKTMLMPLGEHRDAHLQTCIPVWCPIAGSPPAAAGPPLAKALADRGSLEGSARRGPTGWRAEHAPAPGTEPAAARLPDRQCACQWQTSCTCRQGKWLTCGAAGRGTWTSNPRKATARSMTENNFLGAAWRGPLTGRYLL